MKAAIKEGEALVADEAQQAKQLIASLRANNAALEAKLRETEDAVGKDSSANKSKKVLLPRSTICKMR